MNPTAGSLPDCQSSPSDSVTVTIRNSGTGSITNVPVSYRVNGGTITNETYIGTLAPGAVVNHTFATTVNLSAIGVTPNSTLQLRWELGTDGCNGRVGWYVDDITIYNCDYALSVAEFDSIKNMQF